MGKYFLIQTIHLYLFPNMSISGINATELNSISQINSIEKSSIDGVNSVSLPSGFSTDYSVELNGTSQYINLGDQRNTSLNPSQSSINSTGFTLTAWIYLDVLASPTDYIFDLGNCCSNSYYGLKMGVNANGALIFHVMGLNSGFAGAGSNNRNTCRTANSAISAGQWYHVAIVVPSGSMGSTMDRDDWRIYKNGSVVNPSTYVKSGNQGLALTYNGNSSLGVWRRVNNGNFFDGELNNLAVFNTALNATNISAIYNSGTPIDLSTNSGNYNQSANLTAWWRFNEGTGTSYTDSSGNGFTGSGVNTPTWSTNTP